ncbi:ATP-dependent DNA helicase [Bacillus carboniphilus]|uniref:ATP-dependent DNA helicase n=1 Tax=Bacillus carboniphilus TaxID=86663 RepID=A0ABP3FPU9_9BACI
MVQGSYNETDEKEVPVKGTFQHEELTFEVDGRCDGILHGESGLTIDEIKSTSRPLTEVTEESYQVYWAQAKFYGYMFCKEKKLDEIKVKLTYIQSETNEMKHFIKTLTFKELEAFVEETIRQYAPYARLMNEHKQARNKSCKELSFPYEHFRSGQRDFAGAVYKSILDEKNLFAMAPTGTGKTISTTFPAVKAIGEGVIEQFFYVTAKTITRTAAEEALNHMQQKGLQCKAVTITAKDKVCFKENTICNKEYCEFADGYYDRINDACLDILKNEFIMNREVIDTYARKHKVCPFEFSLDLAYVADAIICDYNYLYDPKVSIKRFFEEYKRKTAVLVDEAHNLVDRAREMFSAQLLKSSFLQLKREYKGKNSYLFESAKAINDHLLQLKKQCGEETFRVEQEMPEELIVLVDTFVSEAERELLAETNELLLETYFLVQAFIRVAKMYDERYVTFIEVEKSEVRIKLFCLDPSYLLAQVEKSYKSVVHFSATFSPLGYYKEILGGSKEDYSVSIPSPFPRENLDLYIQPLSTRYRDRERSKQKIVQTIQQVVNKKKGNCLVFFPSYRYMEEVYQDYIQESGEEGTIIQDPFMTERAREQFLEAFKSEPEQSLVGFAVLGGIFSEGVDLKGERLSGVIVVGVGIPQIGVERDLIKDYFNKTGRNGYDYAYVYPGMNKVLQAGGRLIRTETDKGILVLIEDRFLTPTYQRLLPYEWQHYKIMN